MPIMEANLQIDNDDTSNLDKLRRGVLYPSFITNQQTPANADSCSQNLLLNENIQDDHLNTNLHANRPLTSDHQTKPASKKISAKI